MNQRGQTLDLGSYTHTIISLTPEETEELKRLGDFSSCFGLTSGFLDMATKQPV